MGQLKAHFGEFYLTPSKLNIPPYYIQFYQNILNKSVRFFEKTIIFCIFGLIYRIFTTFYIYGFFFSFPKFFVYLSDF